MESQDIRKAGLKVTLPRIRILELLEGSAKKHLSAEELYKALLDTGEEIGIATVYRVLTQFESAGLVERHNFEGGHSVFELKDSEHHDHIVCMDCGKVEEFVDDTIEQRQTAIAERHGFTIADHSMILYGRCCKTNCPRR